MSSPADRQKVVNRYAAIVVPLVLIGIIGYATWVVVVKIAVHYLLAPTASYHIDPRRGAGIAVLVLYFLFLFFTATTYFRILYLVRCDPGLIPCGHDREKGSGLSYFYDKDAFVCDWQGKPLWCSKCECWKPDRTHHCSDIDRCVRRMDHFCPWVGGIVSETNYKFFIQFCFYAFLLTTFTLITVAILLNERKNKKNLGVDVHWAVTLGMAGLFSLFAGGMLGSSLQMLSHNLTTIENLNKGRQVYHIAVLVDYVLTPTEGSEAGPEDEQRIALAPGGRTYRILQTRAGENPWDLGVWRNFKSVLGDRWYDWLLPLKYSPCTNHDRGDGEFEWGPALRRMKAEAGLLRPLKDPVKGHGRKEQRRRRSSHRSERNGRSRGPREGY